MAATSHASRGYARWLWLLLALFVVRVVAQPAALVLDVPYLPRFESWHSGVLPYGVLVATQVLIVGWLAYTAWRFSRGTVTPRSSVGLPMLVVAGVYFASMAARLVLGMTMLRGSRWFASPLPTFFHLVLATYLFLYGHFHFRYDDHRTVPKEPS